METTEKLLRQGDEYLNTENFSAASKVFLDGINAFSDDYRFYLGALRADTKNFQVVEKNHQMEELYRQAVKLAPDEVRPEIEKVYLDWSRNLARIKEEREVHEDNTKASMGNAFSLNVKEAYREVIQKKAPEHPLSVPEPVAFAFFFLFFILVFVSKGVEPGQAGIVLSILVAIGILFAVVIGVWNVYLVIRNRFK